MMIEVHFIVLYVPKDLRMLFVSTVELKGSRFSTLVITSLEMLSKQRKNEHGGECIV